MLDSLSRLLSLPHATDVIMGRTIRREVWRQVMGGRAQLSDPHQEDERRRAWNLLDKVVPNNKELRGLRADEHQSGVAGECLEVVE